MNLLILNTLLFILAPTTNNPESILPSSLITANVEKDQSKEQNQKREETYDISCGPVVEENEKPKQVVRKDAKPDYMESSKKEGLVDGKAKPNTKKVGLTTNDSLLLPEPLKGFSSIAKRKLHILNVENVDFEEMCRRSSLLLNCRIVLDGSERNEPNTTLHAKVYDFNKKRRDNFKFSLPSRNKK